MATSLPAKIKSDFGKPIAVLIVQATDTSTKLGSPVGVPGWDWDGKDSVIIRSLPNLPTGSYSVTFWLLYG